MTSAEPYAGTGLTTSESSPGGGESLDFSQSRAARKQHDQIVRWAQENYQAIRNARVVTERQWYLNLAFYFGKQNVAMLRPQHTGLGPSQSRLWIPPAPYYRARPVINRIRPIIRTELSQLTANRPNASVVPASAEDRDMYAAMAGEQIWYNFYQDKKIKHVIRRAMWWTLVCGNGYIKSWWDAGAGPVEPTKNPMTGEPQIDPETGEPVLAPVGDVIFSPETPFHVMCPDLREEELENQPFLIHAQTKSPEWVEMNFKTALDGTPVKPGASADAWDILDDSFLNLIGTQALDRQRSVTVLECWVKPGAIPLFPEGAFFTLVGDKIVQGFQGWPYSHNKFPFAKFDHIPGGKFYSSSVIEDLIPLQREFNRTRGQIIEAKNRTAKPQYVAYRGSVDATKITSEPGQYILVTPGFDYPQPVPLTPLPNYVVQELDRILADMNDISGQHEVSHGQVPPGVTAATAISYLQERDESKLSHTFDSLEEGIEKIAQMTLTYVHDEWDTERLVRITGPDGSFDVMAFKGSDLQNNLDIRIEGGSSLPVSKAAKQAFIMDLMTQGFIDPREGLEVMDMGGINKIYERIQVDERQAQRENLRMSKVTEEMLEEFNQQNMQMMQASVETDPETGEPIPTAFDGQQPPLIVPVNTWDNHEIHIMAHNNFRKGQAFENLPEFVKALFEAHVQTHIMALGVESETMHPRKAVGLPPEDEEIEEEEAEEEQPGPVGQPERRS